MYPVMMVSSARPKSDMLYDLLVKVREGMNSKGLRFPEAFAIFDTDNVGLVSFHKFAQNLGQICEMSHKGIEDLFALLDRLKIGMFSLDQFRNVVNRTQVGLRLLEKEEERKVADSFEWE